MTTPNKVYALPPVVDAHSRILFLGSMPGTASLAASRYYGHARNHFWPILYRLHGAGAPDESYEDRLRFALVHGCALWDTIAVCEREGSLDADIREAEPTDIPGLLRAYPNIEVIVCNGGKSYDTLNKYHGKDPEVRRRTVLKLPSTSPIPTRQHKGLEEKATAWLDALAPFAQPRRDA
ncbi:DNA-deoxyinosine glycosylase [Cohnella ginsengisoli]|uniref:DNA-deoxyinosine glycosylase n=1 Tax=Cohnella ginsengisoli TaxID=425004 RepID=A0A9X4KJX0_9BACL|nr:DNA-deoxyinosine glycosylase [Cohnella ginsengisoli]MDG0793111.1 DNA-deoxyinosine glycosylase [Cohnella ginsengisoli]